MDHIYPAAVPPVSEMIGNLLKLPFAHKRCGQTDCLPPREKSVFDRENERMDDSFFPAEQENPFADFLRTDVACIRRIPIASVHAERESADSGTVLHTVTEVGTPYAVMLASLADSIRENGVLTPLVVRKHGKSFGGRVQYDLICGKRRLRAASSAGLTHVPCIVLYDSDRKTAELSLLAALQNGTRNIFDEAASVHALLDLAAMPEAALADALSVSVRELREKRRFLRLTEAEREVFLSAHLTERHAAALLRLNDKAVRVQALNDMAAGHMTAKDAEALVDSLTASLPPRHAPLHAKRDIPEKAEAVVSRETPPPVSPVRKASVKDIGLFFNSITNATAALREAGIPATTHREDADGETRVVIVLPCGGTVAKV